ncbi:hypothetical protein SELMODRAFT_403198 [Selaginella moellendorffii]|uniref:HTH psq-type domain-containing protein n=1 Tax=Selaginella moellendorffii TaxID=88036 RepID=D8QTE1_SELML|nr:hypothetical protein SELMODRAFT_403198 [Selaginella moellendorffii]
MQLEELSRATVQVTRQFVSEPGSRSMYTLLAATIKMFPTMRINLSMKNWSSLKLRLCEAMEAVNSGQLSERKAAIDVGIPCSGVAEKRKGMRPGPSTMLSTSEEETLLVVLKVRVEVGYPMTQSELKDAVVSIVSTRDIT